MDDRNTRGEWLDDALYCLANETRRWVLAELRTAGPGQGVDQDALATGERRPSAVKLYHVHLPKLDDMGLVEWNRQAGEVHRGPQFREAEALLEAVEEAEKGRST